MTLSELAEAVGASRVESTGTGDSGTGNSGTGNSGTGNSGTGNSGTGNDRRVGPDVCIDSRRTTPGALFVAFEGEHVDGHDYVQAAFADGAAAALVKRIPAGLAADFAAACLVVDDPQVALGRLARHVVETAVTRTGLMVVGITGSAGKTSTKDLIAQLLEPAGETVAPVGSFNNEIGLPLTATAVGATTRHLVAEMGARGLGHITYLCTLTPPSIGVVLNVGQAHVGEFGSQEAIARAKGELVEALPESGWAVLNGTDPLVRAMAGRTRARVALFAVGGRPTRDGGAAPELAVWAADTEADDLDRHSFTLCVARDGDEPETTRVRLGLVGRHQVANAAAAATAALVAGVSLPAVAAALEAARPRSRWRMEVVERCDGAVVINDAYNANPDSMIAAIETLAVMVRARRRTRPAARGWAVLGQMFELGDTARAEHEATGRAVGSLQVDHLVAVGDNAGDMVAGAVAAGCPDARVAPDRDAVVGMLDLGPDDVVLVKASRAVGLEKVAEALLGSARKGDTL